MSLCSSTFRTRYTQQLCYDSVVYATVKDWTLLQISWLWPVYSSKTYNQLSADFCHSTRWTQAKQNGIHQLRKIKGCLHKTRWLRAGDRGDWAPKPGSIARRTHHVAECYWVVLCMRPAPAALPLPDSFHIHNHHQLLFLIYFSCCIKYINLWWLYNISRPLLKFQGGGEAGLQTFVRSQVFLFLLSHGPMACAEI